MATSKLQVILDAAWRGGSEIKKAGDDLAKVDENATGAEKSLKGLKVGAAVAVGAVVAVGVAAKVAWETLGEGAALIRSREQFDSLTESIGSTADAMLGKLKEATGGLVSDAQLIDSAGQIISLGLGKTEGAVVRLANLVTQLGWDMQQVILTFANNSKARLDSLGLSIEDVEANMVALEAQGYSTDAAFDLAVIQAGEEKLALLGSAADSTVGDIQRLEAAIQNAQDAFAIGFAEGAADEVKLLIDNTDIAVESFERAGSAWGNLVASLAVETFGISIAFEQLERAVKADIITQDEYNKKLKQFEAGRLSAGQVLQFVADKQAIFEGTTKLAALSVTEFSATAALADNVMLRYAGAVGIAAAATGDLIAAVSGLSFRPSRDLPKVLSLTNAQLAAGAPLVAQWQSNLDDKLSPAMRGYSDETTAAKFQTSGLLGVMNRTNPEVEELASGFGGVGVAAETAADKVARLAAETGSFFDQARRGDDFDPAEAFYSAALAAGASADQLQQLLVGTGLETPERAQEIRDESVQRQLASQAGEALAGGGNFDMLWQGIQAGIANPQLAAQQVSNTTNVGGVSVSVVINGNISGEDLDMTVDNAVAEASDQLGGTAGGTN